MTQEEKQLLLDDLCGRLPYGVTYYHDTENVVTPKQVLSLTEINNILLGIGEDIKPYLRPLSSMTKEEYDSIDWNDCSRTVHYYDSSPYWKFEEIRTFTLKVQAWLDKNMFDYRGLIPMGLALEATEGMYENY